MRNQQPCTGEILHHMRHSPSGLGSTHATFRGCWTSTSTSPILCIYSCILGKPESGQDRQYKDRSTTLNDWTADSVDPIHWCGRWNYSPGWCVAGYSWTGSFWAGACSKRDIVSHILLRRNRYLNRWSPRAVLRRHILHSQQSRIHSSTIIRIIRSHNHSRRSNHVDSPSPTHLRTPEEKWTNTIMVRLRNKSEEHTSELQSPYELVC